MIDQRTFNPDAGRAPAIPALPPVATAAPPTPSGPPPLVAIALDPPIEYDAPLHDAIAAAFARNRREFEVRAVLPAGASDNATGAASEAASRVARLITAQGGRASVSAQSDPAAHGAAVLVFVR